MAQRHCEIQAMLQRVYNVMKVCNIIVTSAPVFRTRGGRGFLGKRNLGRIITCEISPNVRFQTRIIRTCIIATFISVSAPLLSLSLSSSSLCQARQGEGEGWYGGLYRINFSDDGLHIYHMYVCTAREQRKLWACVTCRTRLLDRIYAPLHTRLFTPGFSFLKAIVRYATLAFASARDSPKYFLSYVTNCWSTDTLIACRLSY